MAVHGKAIRVNTVSKHTLMMEVHGTAIVGWADLVEVNEDTFYKKQ